MSLKHQCDICKRLFPYEDQLNVISFYERNGTRIYDGLAKANPRLEVCEDCFSFIKNLLLQTENEEGQS